MKHAYYSGSPSSGLPSYSQSTGCAGIIWLHISLWEKASGNQHENADTLATAVSNNEAFVSDPGVSCLQPASMNLYYTKL